ncbi:sensor histidine kinase [Streptomyces acidiscabies]|uniref:sensor histidine kinase n=1 Tax=Streptomyces acidiscabies TaxID=42234 RepID=UPI0030CBABC4
MSERSGADVWDGPFRLWDVYFALVWLVTLVSVLAADRPGWPVRALVVALLVPLVPWYALAGRPLLTGADGRALPFLAGEMVLFLPSAVLVGETRLMTFVLVPHCYMLLRLRLALAVVTVLNVVPVAGWILLWRPGRQQLVVTSLSAVVSLLFSVAVGSWIVRIIEQSAGRAELIAELDASRHEVARLSSAHGALAERERMAREIHDTLAQGFTSLLMLIQAVEAELDADPARARRHLRLMDETARRNLAEARALVAGGAPADLDGTTLPDALRRLALRHSSELSVTGVVRVLPAGCEVVVLRACQEALTNARRHAGSSARTRVRLVYTDAFLTLSVHDDGCGFDPLRADGYGLVGLRARAAEAGGVSEVRSTPGEGTTVTVRLPVPSRKD